MKLISLYLILGLFIYFSSGCATDTRNTTSHRTDKINLDPLASETTVGTLARYEQLAASAAMPADRQYYVLLLAEYYMEKQNFEKASEKLQHINLAQLNPEYHARIALLEAEQAMQKGLAPIALQKLPKHTIDLPPRIQARILKVRAIVLHALGHSVESLEARIRLTALLTTPEATDKNNMAIWSAIHALSEKNLVQLAQKTVSPDLKGWIELTTGLRAAMQSRENRERFLAAWYAHYPNHPAAGSLLEKLTSSPSLTLDYPDNIALLLPLANPGDTMARAAEAIREGFMAAYYGIELAAKPKIHIIDVGTDPDQIWTHQQAAQSKNANIIIGPLHKQSVSHLVSAVNLPIPVLALNYAADEQSGSDQVIQFGLAPEDEARQVAELAIMQKKLRAIILVPQSALGNRMHDAFQQSFESLGGKILASEFYAVKAVDHSDSIEHALGIQQSENRNSILRAVLRQNTKFEPRRRHDIDVIFMMADPKQARSIVPQLKFHQAENIPIYATSHVFSGKSDPIADRDVSGLYFLAAPFTLKNENNEILSPLSSPLSSHEQPAVYTDPKLYALGADVYRILPFLDKLRTNPFERFSGYTGTIYIDHNNRVHRQLTWAAFNRGVPEILDPIKLNQAEE